MIGDSGNSLRHRIEHNAVVGPDLYGRHQQSGAVATVFGAFRTCFVTAENNEYRFRTPDEFLSWEWPWRQLLDTNPETVFAWHADYPALPATLGANLAGFVTRVEGDCQPSPEMAAGTITVDEALRLMTLGSAYALDREREVGSLEVGKYADLAVLNQDPRAVEPAQLESTDVLMTMVGGRIEFCHEAFAAVCDQSATQPLSELPGVPRRVPARRRQRGAACGRHGVVVVERPSRGARRRRRRRNRVGSRRPRRAVDRDRPRAAA